MNHLAYDPIFNWTLFFSTIVMSFGIEQVAVLPLGTALFLIQRFFRVADEQSVIPVQSLCFHCNSIGAQLAGSTVSGMAGNPFGGSCRSSG